MPEGEDPLDFLLRVMNDGKADPRLRVLAAKYAVPYVHSKKGEGGKKDERQDAANKAGRGLFAPSKPPKLAVVGGKKTAAA